MSIPEPGPAERLTLWRAYVPRWAHEPLSGEGAARFGGRWNAKGRRCLYAAEELSTAWAEYNQGFVQHPALIAQLDVTGVRLFDLTAPSPLAPDGAADALHDIPWRAQMDAGLVLASHDLAARLSTAGWHGVVYPSAMSRGGRCVALWRWNEAGGPKLKAVDPEGRLPHDMRSWE